MGGKFDGCAFSLANVHPALYFLTITKRTVVR